MSELSDWKSNQDTDGRAPSPDLRIGTSTGPRDADPPAGTFDNSGRRIAVKPPEWDPLPPDDAIQRYQG